MQTVLPASGLLLWSMSALLLATQERGVNLLTCANLQLRNLRPLNSVCYILSELQGSIDHATAFIKYFCSQ